MVALEQRRRLVSRIAWRGSAGDPLGERQRARDHVAGGDLAHDPEPLRLGGRDDPPGEAELLGDRRRQHRPRRRVAGRDPARQLRVAEAAPRAEATRRSQSSESAKPPASAGPLTAATTGRRQSPTAWKATVLVSTSRSRLSRSPPNWLVSMPEQKALPAPVSTTQPTVVVGRERAERLGELGPQLDRERVALLRPLQGDERDLVAALDRAAARNRMRSLPSSAMLSRNAPRQAPPRTPAGEAEDVAGVALGRLRGGRRAPSAGAARRA